MSNTQSNDGPEYLLSWMARYPDAHGRAASALYRTLALDERMRDFWGWLRTVKFDRLPTLRNSLTVADGIRMATQLPRKPGDMTPGQRKAYFEKVRTHASALLDLLYDTRFYRGWQHFDELSEKELARPLDEVLDHWGVEDDEDDGRIVAFRVTAHEKYRCSYDYPQSSLGDTLGDVIEWTHWEDQWDGNPLKSSAPIAQAKSQSTRIVYFTCTVYEWFGGKSVSIPFRILATLTNVALQLGADQQVDEETVRKQIRRYQARREKELLANGRESE